MPKSHNRKKTLAKTEFGKRLKYKRQEQGLTREALAKRAGLATSYVGSVERGERNLSLEDIVALAAAMHISPSELLPRAQHRKQKQAKVKLDKRLQSQQEEQETAPYAFAEKIDVDPSSLVFLDLFSIFRVK